MSDFIRETLDVFDKERLIDLIIEISENGYLPIELIMLRSDYKYSPEELIDVWKRVYKKALEMDEGENSNSADYFAECARLCFNQALRFEDASKRREFLNMLVNDIQRAGEEDGIGMCEDSEWLYNDVADKILEYMDSM